MVCTLSCSVVLAFKSGDKIRVLKCESEDEALWKWDKLLKKLGLGAGTTLSRLWHRSRTLYCSRPLSSRCSFTTKIASITRDGHSSRGPVHVSEYKSSRRCLVTGIIALHSMSPVQ